MLVLGLLAVLVPLLLFAGAVLLFGRWIRDKSRDSSMILFIVTTVFAVILSRTAVIASPTLMVVLDLLILLVTLLLFAGAVLLFRRWIRDESRASSIILFVVTTVFAVIWSRAVVFVLPTLVVVLDLLALLFMLLLFAGAVLLLRRWIRDESRASSIILFVVTTVFAVILVVVLDFLALLFMLLLFAGAVLLLRRWIRDESRASSIILFVLTTVFAVILSRWSIENIIFDIERIAAATELGVSLHDQQHPYRFPAIYLQERLVEGVTTRAQVHELFKLAKARYLCVPNRRVEKYLFLSSSIDKAVILNVLYHGDVYSHPSADDVYSYSTGMTSQGDSISIENCTLDSDWR